MVNSYLSVFMMHNWGLLKSHDTVVLYYMGKKAFKFNAQFSWNKSNVFVKSKEYESLNCNFPCFLYL